MIACHFSLTLRPGLWYDRGMLESVQITNRNGILSPRASVCTSTDSSKRGGFFCFPGGAHE